MKLYYDNEYNVLKDVHNLDASECLILSDDEGTKQYLKASKIVDDILNDDVFERWKDNSKSEFPPDLINEQDFLVMEVMRVDDHSPDGKKNPVLAKQRQLSEEARPILDVLPKDTDFYINAVTDLQTEQDHNYKYYYSSFQRTLRKHLGKLSTYKNNYPKSKIIFMVFDETSGVYFEKVFINGDQVIGKPHLPFFDNRFLNEFIDSDLDYLIWFIPYNHYETRGEHLTLPRLILFDIKNVRKGTMLQRIDYDEKRMVSNER